MMLGLICVLFIIFLAIVVLVVLLDHHLAIIAHRLGHMSFKEDSSRPLDKG